MIILLFFSILPYVCASDNVQYILCEVGQNVSVFLRHSCQFSSQQQRAVHDRERPNHGLAFQLILLDS